jgi:hypothetical protein
METVVATSVAVEAVELVNGDSDARGDLFEHLF